jgi:hypothetical protein
LFDLSNGVGVSSNTRYQYELVFNLASSKAGALGYALTSTSGATIAQHNATFQGNTTNTIDGYSAGITMASFNHVGAAITTATNIADTDTFGHYVVYGTIDVTTAGNINFLVSQNQNTPTWSTLTGSYIKLTPIGGIGTHTSVGSWS